MNDQEPKIDENITKGPSEPISNNGLAVNDEQLSVLKDNEPIVIDNSEHDNFLKFS